MAAFEKTGLFPVDPAPVITKILHEQLRQQQPINPAYASLLPSETRFQVAADALNDIRQRYGPLMSSPSRENLRVLAKVNTESIAMASHSQGIVSDKNSRTQAYANRMKRGKIVRPRGEFITSSSMADITREVYGRDVEFYTLEQSCDTLMRELKEPSKESFSMIPRREITPPEMSGARSDPTSPTYRYVVVARQ
ncbi:hypothetical protein HRG_014941 [Hirsutella rhossiliensis]